MTEAAGDESEPKKILFVDDEPHLLSGLKRALRGHRHEWDMHFAASGNEALGMAEEIEFDAVISDMRMPGMDGAALLKEMAARQPHTLRVVLSGHSEEKSIMSLVGVAHRFLAKPCDVDALSDVLSRAFSLQGVLLNPALRSMVNSLGSLPTIPEIYTQLIVKLQHEDTTLREIGKLIERDPGISAKLLQVVNSAFFGMGRRISSPEEAASLLGMDTLRALVLTAGVFKQFEGSSSPDHGPYSLQSLWQDSLAVGMLAREIAREEQVGQTTVDDALAGGVLHGIGLLVLLFCADEHWRKIVEHTSAEGIPLEESERALIQATHNELGAYLLGLWGLPQTVVEVVAFVHDPLQARGSRFCALTAVHVADALLHPQRSPDMAYLQSIGLEQRLNHWRLMAESTVLEHS